ncbi:putative MET22-protein ser/thr phosphatase [Meira miltonrushii]|uniref:3'(2'),5'-bisphosphate nucleotidase n=1 Tax=Meira miltonrushii TaxID=1280837 RepID=A0A316VLF9_9BASI|nr:putative MET22-protein ser/thr phosphatase [Meira miltonrushii]PWN38432.1 putative MET22-protein ser/thr phosphatase [Meira miltonrushii]
MSDYRKEQEVAIEAVRRASLITQKVLQTSISSLTKSDKSPVTVGDFSAQAIINAILAKHFSDDKIVGEEDADDLRSKDADKVALKEKVIGLVNEGLMAEGADQLEKPLSETEILEAIDKGNCQGGVKGRMWTLDPIDGTKGFLRGGQYAVCLALIVDGEVRLGVMGCPNLPIDKSAKKPQEGNLDEVKQRDDLGVIFVASEGKGAFQRPLHATSSTQLTPIKTREITPEILSKASFCESVEAGHSSQGTNAKIAEFLGISSPSVRMDSQAKYASVARGDGDIYLRLPVGDGSYQEKIWDHAAGCLIVTEAGGKVSDAKGRPLDFSIGRTLKNNKGVVAAHASVHAKVIEAVRKALEEEGRGHL